MIYFDNAATSRFKPKSVYDALIFDIAHSANAGRGGHSESIAKTLQIEKCRKYLLSKFGANQNHNLIFTKNCTEALNLALLCGIKKGARVLTSQNEHNSVLRPLFKLKNDGVITLEVLEQDENGHIRISDIEACAQNFDYFVFGGACNVTGAVCDIKSIGQIAKNHGVKLIIDGAQSVPYIPIDMQEDDVCALACPGHKGLHGVQGTGFLIVRNDMPLTPLIFGGTGTQSIEVSPTVQMPDSFEAGTQFSGGISALYQGAKWSFDNVDKSRKNIVRLSKNLINGLNTLDATIYTRDIDTGIVAFNFGDIDSTLIADKLNDYDICVRSGLHCAPLVHKYLGTTCQGAIRVSFGCDNNQNEVAYFLSVLERILQEIKN